MYTTGSLFNRWDDNTDTYTVRLGNQVNKGEKMGMDEDQLAKAATKVADYLAASEEPRNREEQILKELWKATENDDEKKTVAKTLVRMAQKTN